VSDINRWGSIVCGKQCECTTYVDSFARKPAHEVKLERWGEGGSTQGSGARCHCGIAARCWSLCVIPATTTFRKVLLIFLLKWGAESTTIPTRLPIAPKGEATGTVLVGERQLLRNLADTRPPERGQRQRSS
jgi:hypothetical protein